MEQERVYDHANETLGSYHRIERSNDPISNPCLDVATEERVESVHRRLKKDMCQAHRQCLHELITVGIDDRDRIILLVHDKETRAIPGDHDAVGGRDR